LARLRKGKDAGAWRLFVELYTPLIYRFCHRRGLQDADAEEVTQAVMARVFLAIGKFAYDPERGRFRNWLGVIAIHEISRYRQRAARPGQGIGGGEGESLAERIPGPDESDWLEEFNSHVLKTALERIRHEFDEPTWQAFDWTWIGDVKPATAAKRLGKAVAWIYKARFRVLKRLRVEVEFLAEDAAILHRPH
jgi:RNA polymerase sigma factor (sigma-70 family)